MGKKEPGPIHPTKYPVPPEALSPERLSRIMEQDLPDWEIVRSLLPENPLVTRAELFREFRFDDFEQVMEYMSKVAVACEILPHHPRWENIWTTLRVFLTTWDAVHIISYKDVMLARIMDKTYLEYLPKPISTRTKERNDAEKEDFKKQVTIHVEKDDLEKAYESLTSYDAINRSDRTNQDDFSMLKNRYNSFQRDIRAGLLSRDEQIREHAQIVKFFFSFIKTI